MSTRDHHVVGISWGLFLVTLAGCTGFIEAPGSERGADDPAPWDPSNPDQERPDGYEDPVEVPDIPEVDPTEPTQLAAGILSEARRLTPLQYANAVRDLFGGRLQPGTFDVNNPDLSLSGYTTDAVSNRPNAAAVQQLFFAAEDVAIASVEVMGELLPCAISGPDARCVDSFVDRYVSRAYRRPATAEERAAYQSAYANALSADFSEPEAFAVLIEILLQSAPFLYVTEIGETPAVDGRIELTHFEIATRLSLIYQDSIPDEALWNAASSGQLKDKAELERHARRLLALDSAPFVRRFVNEWLHLTPELDKDSATFPDFDAELASAFQEEMVRFFRRAIDEDLSLSELLAASDVPINARLAAFYGIADFSPGPDGWATVTLPQRHQGLFARPYYLASHAAVRDTSPVHRGLSVMTQVLCSLPGSPPDNADTLEPDYPPMATARQRSEILRSSSTFCAGCHSQIDNIGLAFENFDAIGRWRDVTPEYEGTQVIDASGFFARTGAIGETDVAGLTFEGAQGLGLALSGSQTVETCLSRHVYRFSAHRRESGQEDVRLISELRQRFRDEERSLAALFVGITQADAFQFRSVESP